MKRSFLVTSLLVTCVGFFCAAAFGEETSQKKQEAYTFLKGTDVFVMGPFGEAGVTSDGEEALKTLLEARDAAEKFKSLLKEATLTGQLYALCGLKVVDPDAFDRAVKRCLLDFRRVRTLKGCIGFDVSVSSTTKAIRSGEYDAFLKREVSNRRSITQPLPQSD
jgi:hypothetical protein